MLELAVSAGASVLLGQHLGQNPVAQPQRRIAEARQPKALQQLCENLRAGHNNLRPPRPDAFHSHALGQRHRDELVSQSAHLARGSNPGHWRGQHSLAHRERLNCLAGRLLSRFTGLAASISCRRRNRIAQRSSRA
jgi:hypothetical protein